MKVRIAVAAIAAWTMLGACSTTASPAGPPGGGSGPAPAGGSTAINGFSCPALLSAAAVRTATGVGDLSYDSEGEAVRLRGSTICAYDNSAGSHVKVTIYVEPHYAQLFKPQYTNARDTGLGRAVPALGSWAIWMEPQREL